jgi:hypothetical protein
MVFRVASQNVSRRPLHGEAMNLVGSSVGRRSSGSRGSPWPVPSQTNAAPGLLHLSRHAVRVPAAMVWLLGPIVLYVAPRLRAGSSSGDGAGDHSAD